MNVLGSRTIHYYAGRRIVTRSLEILLFACWLLSASNLSSISTTHLRELVRTQFAPETPGLAQVLSKANRGDGGFSFELEAALLLAQRGERIIGFDLDIRFCDREHRQCHIDACLDGYSDVIDLGTTEFDIVTSAHAVECKSGKNAKIEQLTKERNMLTWCKELVKEMESKQLAIKYLHEPYNKPFIIINGPATCYQAVYITSEWITEITPKACISQFKDIVYLLAEKEHLTLFGGNLDSEKAHHLTNAHINFEDNIHLVAHQTRINEPMMQQQISLDSLLPALQNLSLC